MKALLNKEAKFHVDVETVSIRHVVTGILPCARTTHLKLDANTATNAIFDTLSLKRSPTRSRRKEVRKDQLLCGIDTNELRISGWLSVGAGPPELVSWSFPPRRALSVSADLPHVDVALGTIVS